MNIIEALQPILKEQIRSAREVKGGDIGHSLYVETVQGRFFVKYRLDIPKRMFECEKAGLDALRKAGVLSVPKTVYAGEIPGQQGGVIVLEWIDCGQPHEKTEDWLGRGLAQLHSVTSSTGRFGLDHDNYIGILPQENGWCDEWTQFYRGRRLMPMVKLADERGLLGQNRRKQLLKLLDTLDRFIPNDSQASLLHGDFWSGNWITGPDGKPYLIDPAVFYGDREYEIAFTELFGGFSPRFYAAYREVAPLPADYHDRRPLYQLYYLLVHLILFGETYGASVDRILKRYV